MNGMDDNEDETDLFDDDFDSLSESALRELEHHAFLSTQQASLQASANARHEHFSSPSNQYRVQARAPLNTKPQPRTLSIQRHLTDPQSEDESFELVGEEGVATPVDEYEVHHLRRLQPNEVVQREHFRQQRNAQAYNGRLGTPEAVHRQPEISQAIPPHRRYTAAPSRSEVLLDGPSQEDGGSLQQKHEGDVPRPQLQQLIRQRDELARQLEATKETVMMQKGEISIIRANFEKEIKVFDRQISALQKTMAEESAQHTAALNAMMEKNNTLSTRYNFLQQEHNQELQNIKTLQQRLKDRQQLAKETNPVTTPKRGTVSSLRDGFDDDDVMAISPSKSGRRSKPSTPPAANKRKRKADLTSPVKPLVLRASGTISSEMPPPPQPQSMQVEDQSVIIVRTDKQAERNLRFLQDLLEYRVGATETLVEALVKFSSPGNPSKTFSAILLEKTARLKGPWLPRDLVHIFIDLWSKSLKEEYYKPIDLFIQVVNHIIELDPSVLDANTVAPLAVVLQNSAYINARTRFKHSPGTTTFGEARQTPQSLLNHHVNGTACMELLLTIAYAVSDELDLLSLFWREMPPDFVMMMLTIWQPVPDITTMLRLLATSTLSSTFGSICVDSPQEYMEHHLLTRISSLLWETPKVDEGLPANTTETICRLRVEVMNLLIQIAITSSPHNDQAHHGSRLIANHPSAIGRIVRSLYDEVSAMYQLTPSHALHAEIVNKGVQLLYHVLRLHSAEINIQEKLSVVNGGVHKHRVVLTRLAFSEGFYIDRLIRDETVAMATSMLEESVTPDEADELIEAFPGFKGRGGNMVVE